MQESSDKRRRAALTHAGELAALVLAALLGGCHQSQAPAQLPVAVVAVAVHTSPSGEAGAPLRYPVEVAARYSNAMSFRVAGQLIERRRAAWAMPCARARWSRVSTRPTREKQAASARAALRPPSLGSRSRSNRSIAIGRKPRKNLIAQNQLEQTQDAYSAALAARDQAADQLVVARNTLRYNSLVAEHDGVITSENADTGQVVSAGQAVYGLAWSDETDVILDAAPGDLGRIAVGQAASVTFSGAPRAAASRRACARCRRRPIRRAEPIG